MTATVATNNVIGLRFDRTFENAIIVGIVPDDVEREIRLYEFSDVEQFLAKASCIQSRQIEFYAEFFLQFLG